MVGKNFLILILWLGFYIKLNTCIVKAAKLRTWLEAGGAYINPNVEVEMIPNVGYGLKATARLSFHETICCIPREFCMVSIESNAVENIATQLRNEKFPSIKDKVSFYQPFLDVLPDDVSYLPSMWSAYNQELLEGSSLINDAKMMKSEWIESYERMFAKSDKDSLNDKSDMKDSDVGTSLKRLKDQWLWSRATLQCRAYCFKIKATSTTKDKQVNNNYNEIANENINNNENKDTDQLVVFFPFIGFANHNDAKHCSISMGNGINELETSVVVRTQDVYQPGEPICISYGDMSFNQKVLSFGWIDDQTQEFITCEDDNSCTSSGTTSISTTSNSYYITPIDIAVSDSKQIKAQIEIKTIISKSTSETKLAVTSANNNNNNNKRKPNKLMMKHTTDKDGNNIFREIDKAINTYLIIHSNHTKEKAIEYISNELIKKQEINNQILKRLENTMENSNSRHLYDLSVSEAQYIITLEINAINQILEHLNSN